MYCLPSGNVLQKRRSSLPAPPPRPIPDASNKPAKGQQEWNNRCQCQPANRKKYRCEQRLVRNHKLYDTLVAKLICSSDGTRRQCTGQQSEQETRRAIAIASTRSIDTQYRQPQAFQC